MVKKTSPNILTGLQVLAHASVLPMFLYGNAQQYLISLLVFFMTGCFGMSMTYHRLISHRSWNAPAWFKHFGLLCGTIGLTGSALSWCSVHRLHHQHSDTGNDPHSPHHTKPWRVQFLSMNYEIPFMALRSLAQDKSIRFFHRHYLFINFFYVLVLAIFDPFAVVYAYLFPACVLWNSGSLINSVGHMFGYKNFPTQDEGRNNIFLAFLNWGEGWHNNHHRYPKRAYFGYRWFEIDIAGILIKIIRKREFHV